MFRVQGLEYRLSLGQLQGRNSLYNRDHAYVYKYSVMWSCATCSHSFQKKPWTGTKLHRRNRQKEVHSPNGACS